MAERFVSLVKTRWNFVAIAIAAGLVLLAASSRAGPLTFNLPDPPPPVIEDSTKIPDCTAVWLVTDTGTNDTIAVRMLIAPGEDTRPVNNVMPCPDPMPPRLALRALDACIARAGDPRDCVYTDMGRDFEQRPGPNNSAENTSRCTSDTATDIGVACFRSGDLQVCGVGCGRSPATAIKAAVERCEAKHLRQCDITGSQPVLAPR